ncbi:hypothetical protein [Candidatus Pyrohabitans sp.]
MIELEDIIAHKLASDIAALENVISCYVIKDGEIIGAEEKQDLKEMAIIPAALISELCEDFTTAKLRFSDCRAVVVRHEEAELVVFFDKNTPEASILSDITDIISGVSI